MAEATGTELSVTEDQKKLPATTDTGTVVAGDGESLLDNEESPSRLNSAVSQIGGGSDITRQVVIIGFISVCFALVVLLFVWIQEPDMRPLGKYDTEEMITVLDYLDQNGINYKVDGNAINVNMDDYEGLKLKMMRAGLASGGSKSQDGDDILLTDMGFGVSQQLERERLKLSRERQIAEAIMKFAQVQQAKVMLALPKQSVFARYNQDASATVFLHLKTGIVLNQEKVDAIVDLVATAVPGLKPTRITVTDQSGHLLSSGTEDPTSMARRKEYELERKQENALIEKINTILIPVVGFGNYTAQVDITLDFTATEQTSKSYDPSITPKRSEYILEDYNSAKIAQGIPGALTNQPPVNSDMPEEVDNNTGNVQGNTLAPYHKEATRNYEIDTTISHKRSQIGTINRQTVSVAVKDRQVTDPATGDVSSIPFTSAELQKISRLLMGAVGYSAARGDVLEVVSVPFVSLDIEGEVKEVPIWEHPRFGTWVRWISAAIIIAVIVLVLVRPAMMNLLYGNVEPDEFEELGEDGLPVDPNDDNISLLGSDVTPAGEFAMSSTVSLPDLHKDEDLLRAVRALVANEPDLAAQVIRSWVGDE